MRFHRVFEILKTKDTPFCELVVDTHMGEKEDIERVYRPILSALIENIIEEMKRDQKEYK